MSRQRSFQRDKLEREEKARQLREKFWQKVFSKNRKIVLETES